MIALAQVFVSGFNTYEHQIWNQISNMEPNISTFVFTISMSTQEICVSFLFAQAEQIQSIM
jgi:hypothetical protein